MNPLTQFKNITIPPILITVTLICFAFPPSAQAVCQQGCRTNSNTVLGDDALVNTSGNFNTAIGAGALHLNSTGGANTANGEIALQSNTTGSNNTANGAAALTINSTGGDNTANGAAALADNTTGSFNTANGADALRSNDADNNTATGFQALYSNTTGTENTANGVAALFHNTNGGENTATGFNALLHDTGNSNTASGAFALQQNTTGGGNQALGVNALGSNTIGSHNTAIGYGAGVNLTTGSNNIDIGHAGLAGESKTIRIGTSGTQTKTFIAGISGVAVTGSTVVVNSNGKLGVTTSSERFKEKIKPMDNASETILALKPVTFRYKKEIDPERTRQFGLVAEDVEKIDPELVVHDEQGKPYTVRYDAVNAMLLNEFVKEHRTVQEQGAMIARQQKQIEALTAVVQKVSAQLELNKPAAQTVVNNR
jgi:Chaperone of endosialidase